MIKRPFLVVLVLFLFLFGYTGEARAIALIRGSGLSTTIGLSSGVAIADTAVAFAQAEAESTQGDTATETVATTEFLDDFNALSTAAADTTASAGPDGGAAISGTIQSSLTFTNQTADMIGLSLIVAMSALSIEAAVDSLAEHNAEVGGVGFLEIGVIGEGGVILDLLSESATAFVENTGVDGFEIVLGDTLVWMLAPGETLFASAEVYLEGYARAAPEIDIKPGSDSNRINPFSRGVIPVAILTTPLGGWPDEEFDALTVDAESVLFGPAEAEKKHTRAHVEDVDDDGDLDLKLHFPIMETGIALGDTEVCLNGETYDGVPFTACDSIRTTLPRRRR